VKINELLTAVGRLVIKPGPQGAHVRGLKIYVGQDDFELATENWKLTAK
jgi:hypothetical protein